MKEWWDSYPDHEHVKEKPTITNEQVQRLRQMKAAAHEKAISAKPADTLSILGAGTPYKHSIYDGE